MENHDGHHQEPASVKEFVDPVCGMKTTEESQFMKYEHEGQPFYFCSDTCLTKFKENPEKYTHFAEEKHEKERLQETAGTGMYTCPMHPEVRQIGPGSCPICGMALEPVMPTDSRNVHRGPRKRDRFKSEPP